MRTGKELILATKPFCKESISRSWIETLLTLLLIFISITLTFFSFPLPVKLLLSVLTGLLYVRLFVIYHDYQHHAILQNSNLAKFIMNGIGIYLLAPSTIWKRSHDHHHFNNSKLTLAGIGSYPTISKEKFLSLTKSQKNLYLINRHPLTIIFGYFTLFIFWLNIKSYAESPGKHLDSLIAVVFHFLLAILIIVFFGISAFLISWFIPFFIAFGIGSYLFYCQHNFPKATFSDNKEWSYEGAAIHSTSFMRMSLLMHWFTGNIGYHNVHHLNSRIPFYRLKEAMKNLPELADVPTTSWNPVEVYRCFMLKLWDEKKGKMIRLSEL